MSSLHRRVSALEAKSPQHGGRVMVLIQLEGAPLDTELHYNGQSWYRVEGESYEDFRARALAEANGPDHGPLVFFTALEVSA